MKSEVLRIHLMKSLICALALISFSSNSYSQIDSVNVAITFTAEVDSTTTDSLGMYVIEDVINVSTSVHDVDFLGVVIVTIYDHATDYPIAMLKMTKQQFIDLNQKVGSTVTLKIYGIDNAGSYRIEIQVRNFQGANFPMVITNYNII